MSKADRYSAFVWFIFSVLASHQSYKLGMGSLHQPGPGFVFFWTATIVALLSLAVVLRSFVEKPEEEGKNRLPGSVGAKKALFVLIALFLYALLLERVGFVLVTFLLLLFLLRTIEKKPWWLSLLAGVAITAATYFVFETALQSQLPKGLLEYMRF
jgi:putative tricarboxylic transport membrane protein